MELEAGREHISAEVARMHEEYYGHPPGSTRTSISDNVIVVLIEETFTPAEKTLIGRGEAEEIQTIRRRFQQVMADDFKAVVEQATGRAVRSFTSDTDLEEHLSMEVFVLGETREDMSSFQRSVDDGPAPGH